MSTAIVTDSNCGITPAEARELGIFVVPMPFFIDGELFYEGINLSQAEFFRRMGSGADITTSQPTPGDVLNKWDEALEAHGGSLPTTVHFVFDEFANIGRIPDFERTIAVTRSRNIAVSMIAQSLSQLKETYGDNNAETIVNACDTLLYLGGKANETNEEISKMAGKQTVASETQSDSRGAGWTRTVNRGISERDLIQPAEVARMPREDALVLVNGCMPLMDRKYRLERHPRSRLLEEAARRGPFDFAEYRRRKDGAS